MDVALGIWSAGLFFLAGLTIGRIKWGRSDERMEEEEEAGTMEAVQDSRMTNDAFYSRGEQRRRHYDQESGEGTDKSFPGPKKSLGEKKIPLGWAVGSPVSGTVSYFHEGTKRGAMITPEQGVLYAPVAGKITRLYPTGNAMRLRTDYGIELLIQAGVDTGELEGRYYRARVVKNEVVNKGKPLLEFDVEGIRSEGYDPSVMMSVEDAQDYQNVTVCDAPRVKAGENLMWVLPQTL